MRFLLKFLLLGFLLTFSLTVSAAAEAPYSILSNQVNLKVDLFLSSTCPYCQKADQFFKDLEAKDKSLNVQRYIINTDVGALETFAKRLQQENSYDFSVPAIFFCNTHWVGLPDNGKQIIAGLNYCRQQILKTGRLTKATEEMLRQLASANWYKQRLAVDTDSILFAPLMALLGSMTPAAAFSILCLYAFIILDGSKKKLWLRNCLLFAIGAGFISFLQQLNPGLSYKILVIARILALIIGLILISYIIARQYWQQKPKYLAAPIIILLTFMIVQIYQQLYTPNFSLIYHQWLEAQKYPPLSENLHSLLFQIYHLAIMISIASLMVLVTKLLSKWSKYKGLIVEFAALYLMLIGLILIMYPLLFSKLFISYIVIFLASIFSWLSFMFKKS